MTNDNRPRTLAELKSSGWVSKPVKQEIYDNFVRKLEAGETLYPTMPG